MNEHVPTRYSQLKKSFFVFFYFLFQCCMDQQLWYSLYPKKKNYGIVGVKLQKPETQKKTCKRKKENR